MPLHYNSTISKNAYQSPYFFFLCIHHLTPFIFDVNHLQNFSFSFFFSFFYSVKFKHLFDHNIYSPPSFPESPYLSLFPRSRARLILLTQKTKRGLSWEENRSTNQRAPRYKSSKAWEWACAFLKKKKERKKISLPLEVMLVLIFLSLKLWFDSPLFWCYCRGGRVFCSLVFL